MSSATELQSAPVRLGRLARLIPSASKKVLTENLRELEAGGIVVRRDLSGTVRHIEYDFSEAMRPAMISILDCLVELGDFHLSEATEHSELVCPSLHVAEKSAVGRKRRAAK